MKKRIHCGICGEQHKDNDPVHLDEGNTVTHQDCYSERINLDIKDSDTYVQIINRYDFFDNLR